MQTLIQKIEKIGQMSSIHQHASLQDMLEQGNHDLTLVQEIQQNSEELFCIIEFPEIIE